MPRAAAECSVDGHAVLPWGYGACLLFGAEGHVLFDAAAVRDDPPITAKAVWALDDFGDGHWVSLPRWAAEGGDGLCEWCVSFAATLGRSLPVRLVGVGGVGLTAYQGHLVLGTFSAVRDSAVLLDQVLGIVLVAFFCPAVPMMTGQAEIAISNNWQGKGRVFIRQSDPLPLSVLAVIPEVTIGGR
ncbi:hypothetical protein [Pseudomonas lactucae]|uniref:Uncharacterized protein n=1 Tax=Pseudomonas lactucae TaxID=2813360 RepID=A0A9X0YBA4_9PSED|nr:hypothetical protein [Pseudomonas lactucae]MBN2976933.1 hypothetical protein [Pseudomonas lactucae]MBN2988450.1 hypothetical protein [Pseudomonas lactucae]